jgi:alpha-amylase/alpha-mannosidase (GH57 family)
VTHDGWFGLIVTPGFPDENTKSLLTRTPVCAYAIIMANVVFLWHMHQPYYVDPTTRTALMPWVRLHSVKGYLDMVSVIEDFPGIRVNFNLTPVLLLQIQQLVDGEIRDLWLDWSRKPAADLNDEEKFAVLENFFKIHWDNLVRPFPRYWELLNKRGLTLYKDEVRRGLRYFSTQEILDLQVWFNLAWCGYTADRLYPELAALRAKGRDFNEEDKSRVLDIHLEIMRLVIGKYRAAEERGQAELTTTPFFHPILPLVYDSHFAERSLPGRRFPKRYNWPQDAEAQLTLAVAQHEKFFGKKPRGLWPSEGSIAPELIPLMERVGISYFCSDEENLFNSLKRDPAFRHAHVDHLELFQGWRVHHDGAAVNAVFREKPLSDFIGFMAARNDAREAAGHLLHHMRHIAGLVPHDTGVIPLILDGENAWETFADGGEAFLRALYGGIEEDANSLHSCTIEDYFQRQPPVRQLTTLHTGSWIGSNFDIWIGEEEENRAWDLLGEARAFLQNRLDDGTLAEAQRGKALEEIYAAEGSDWFWWYGPDFHTDNDGLFDDLFRKHLKNVYTACGSLPPAELELPLIAGAKPVRNYEPPRQLVAPLIDGRLSSYFEWTGAGSYEAGSEQGAMYRSGRFLEKMYFGFGEESLFLRIDPRKWEAVSLAVRFFQPDRFLLKTKPLARDGGQEFTITTPSGVEIKRATLAAAEIIEWEIALLDLALKPGDTVAFQLRVLQDGIERERYPESGPVQLTVPGPGYAMELWAV